TYKISVMYKILCEVKNKMGRQNSGVFEGGRGNAVNDFFCLKIGDLRDLCCKRRNFGTPETSQNPQITAKKSLTALGEGVASQDSGVAVSISLRPSSSLGSLATLLAPLRPLLPSARRSRPMAPRSLGRLPLPWQSNSRCRVGCD